MMTNLRVMFLAASAIVMLSAPALAQEKESGEAQGRKEETEGVSQPKAERKPETPAKGSVEAGEEGTERASEQQQIVITARGRRRVQDEPLHVEVIGRDEIEESSSMAPGQVAHLLSETSGVRLQVVSPSLGAANLSIRGLPGRYTQILADGLPLYGGQTGALAILQIPPSDLGRVEVIKGSASALYGPSALGGVINLVSRQPADDVATELTFNANSRKAQDMVGYASGPLSGGLGFSLLGQFDRQSVNDLDHDGWADLPKYDRAVFRPRLFWKDSDGNSIFVTAGVAAEDRRGGTIDGRLLPDGGTFPESLSTRRGDLGTVAQFHIGGNRTLNFRASVMGERDRQQLGDDLEHSSRSTAFSELSLAGEDSAHSWTLGAAFQRDVFRSREFGTLDYTFTFPSLFAQDEYEASDRLTVAASARVDFHNRYGTLFSPRISALFRPRGWTVRASVGSGYFTPTSLTEETGETGLSRILPLRGVKAEQAITGSIDIGRHVGPLEFNGALFYSVIKNPVDLVEAPAQPGRFEFVNVDHPYRSPGAELLARYHRGPFTLTGGYVFLHPTKMDPETGRRVDVQLMPRHSATFAIVWEDKKRGRLGFEGLYTGRQRLEDNPYRTESRPYLQFGLLGELHVSKKLSLFVNAENLTDVRQTKFDPLVLPARAPDGRWTVDEWAPLEGRVINGGLRADF